MTFQKRIDAYLDCNSPYSLFAFQWLLKNRAALAEHDVVVDFHPIFLGGLNVGSGNKPPWTLPAKAAYGALDRPRAEKYFGTGTLKAPPFFPILSLLPLRCMLFAKSNFSKPKYEAAFLSLWTCYWDDWMDISKSETMLECLKRTFSEDEAKDILAGGQRKDVKEALTRQTEGLVQRGAFGAPWCEVRDGSGKVEAFFGSDRFHYMLQYLDVPFQDIEILPAAKGAKL